MSILLEGKLELSEKSLWRGIWHFAKDKKSDLAYQYERLNCNIPKDLIRYVSFEEEPIAAEGEGTAEASEEAETKAANEGVMEVEHSANDNSTDSVLIPQTYSMYGLWKGIFEIGGGHSHQSPRQEVDETLFICGKLVNGESFDVDEQLANLPPAPMFSYMTAKRNDLAEILKSKADLLESEKEATADAERSSACQHVGHSLVLFGFGRNQYGRFSIILAIDEPKGTVVAEKRYMLTKHATPKRPKIEVPKDVSTPSRAKTERVVTRKKFDDEAVDSDLGSKKKRAMGVRAKLESPENGSEHMIEEERVPSPVVEEEDEDFRSAFLDDETGELYEGGWQLGYRHGYGICVYADGNMYEGSWVYGREHGHGTLMTGQRQVLYSGEWCDGFVSGHGTFHYSNGDTYKGDWKEGLRHGRGEYIVASGCKYVGDWKDNKRQGKGIFTWPDGSVYDGEWENDARHGRGIFTTTSGLLYDGMWSQNYMDGRGYCRFPDGQEYHGTYKLGLREGRGSITFPEGALYEGRFREDRIDGQGTIKMELATIGSSEGEMLIPIQADIRRIHLKAGFGADEVH